MARSRSLPPRHQPGQSIAQTKVFLAPTSSPIVESWACGEHTEPCYMQPMGSLARLQRSMVPSDRAIVDHALVRDREQPQPVGVQTGV